MTPQAASSAAGLILVPFFLVSALQFGRWVVELLAACLTGWLT